MALLTFSIQKPDGTVIPNPSFNQWIRVDQNLAAAICSTLSPSILPYVLHLESCSDIWTTIELRLQPYNRSRIFQLKNELHNVSMKNLSMTQYLTSIKTLVDNIVSAGASVETEDIILYTLNGLPQSYQAFKTSIRTKLTPISLDDLYALLISEEINLSTESSGDLATPDPNSDLYSYRGRGRRGRGRFPSNVAAQFRTSPMTVTQPIICQICSKKGHSAITCWHRLNMSYSPQPSSHPTKALVAATPSLPHEWTLCKYRGKNIAFHVNEGSTDYWLSLLVEFEDGDGDIGSMHIKSSTSTEWKEMKHVWGASWCIIGGPLMGPFSVKLTTLSTQRTLSARDVIPRNWSPKATYTSRLNFF